MERMINNTKDNLADALQQMSLLMPGGVFCYDVDENQEFLYISDSMPIMFGYTMKEFQAKFNNRFPDMIYEEDRERILKEIAAQIQNGNDDSCMYRVQMANGALKWIFDRGRIVTDKNGKRWFYVVIVDADELKAAEQKRIDYEEQLLRELRGQPENDITTGFLNRYATVAYIEKAIPKYFGGTLFLLHIDNFQSFTDMNGTPSGKHLLKDIASSIRYLVHPEEILGRFSIDTFIIFAPGDYNRENAERRAAELIRTIQEVVEYDIKDGGCSIGIAISGNAETTFQDLLTCADKALRHAKIEGNAQYYTKPF